MQVDNVSSTNQDPKKPNAAGLAKSALGWINRVISESVQEISDFSAMLSAQTSAPEADAKSKSAPNKSKSVEDLDLVSQAQNQVQVEDVSVIATKAKLAEQPVKLNKSKTSEVEDKELNNSSEQVEETEAQVPSEDNSEAPVVETKQADTESTDEAVVVTKESEPNTLAAELAAAQLQSSPQATEVEEAKTTEITVEADEGNTAQVPNKEAVISEKLPAEVEKDLVDFARVSAKKPQVAEAAPAENVSKAKEVAASSETELKPESSGVEIPEQFVSPQVTANTQTVKTPQSNTSTASLGLAQSFLNTWTGSSVAAESRHEEAIRTGIEALNGARQGQNVNKGQVENHPTGVLNAKASDAAAMSDRALNVSFGLSGSEQSQKGESAKNSKPLTRTQSLATLERVESALQKAAESKDGTQISLRLDPPNLGSVKVDVSFKEGSLHARISADSAQVLQLLRDKAPELQVVLRKLGLDVDKVSVSVNSGDLGHFNEGSDGKQGGSDKKGGNNFPQLADSAAMPELLNLDHWIA